MKNELKGSWRRRLADWIIHKLGGYTEQQVFLSSNHTSYIREVALRSVPVCGSIEITEDLVARNYYDPSYMQHIYREAMDQITNQIGVYLRDHHMIHFKCTDNMMRRTKILTGEVRVQMPEGWGRGPT